MPRLFGRFLGNTVSGAASFSVGSATARSLDPFLQDLTNDRWASHPSVPIEATLVADGVASGEIPMDWALAEAKRTGFNADRFQRLVDIADVGPGSGQAFRLWRRNLITETGFRRALKRDGLEDEWIDALAKTRNEPLNVAVIANAIQQGFINAPGVLPPASDTTAPIDVPTERVDIDALTEAEWSGVPSDHLKVLAFLSGNPPGPETLADMWNRGIITEAAYEQGIREGRTKTKWIPALKLKRFEILTAIQAVNLWLRGWITRDQALAHGAKQGYTADLMDLLYKGQGRPLTMRQAWIGHQRGGEYDGPTGQIPDWYLTALRQSSLRPEWYSMAWAQRHSLPSAFVIRGLAESGDLTRADAERLLLWSGWPEDLAAKVSQGWTQTTATTAKGLTVSDLGAEYESGDMTEAEYVAAMKELGYSDATAREKLTALNAKIIRTARQARRNRIHMRYVNWKIDRDEATTALADTGMRSDVQRRVFTEWDAEREVNTKLLTPAQIKKAYFKELPEWTRTRALAELMFQGYDPDEAETLLDS